MRPAIFAVALTAFIAIAILAPDLLKDIKVTQMITKVSRAWCALDSIYTQRQCMPCCAQVDTAFYLGVASFFLGLATSLTYLKSLLGRPGGLGKSC